MNIWRLNVRESQFNVCVSEKLFAINTLPRNPEIKKGDLLLLQLVSRDALKLSKRDARIEYVLIFDRYEEDYNGMVSRLYWPNADKVWRWILRCNDIVETIPFSLENLYLSTNYAGQTNPVKISDSDVSKVMAYLLRYEGKSTSEIGMQLHNFVKQSSSPEYNLWALIRNNDRIVEAAPDKVDFKKVPERIEIKRNPELPFLLKELYRFRCQICEKEFESNYGIPYSETHHIICLSRGGVDHSNNLMVVCPNHHRIIHETKPDFDRERLTFEYPNGYKEHLVLTEHFKEPTLLQNIKAWADKRFETIQKEKNFQLLDE